MVSFAEAPRKYEDMILREIDGIAPSQLPHIFRNPAFHPSSRHLSIVKPSPTDRHRFVVNFASRRIFELLWEKHIQHRVCDMGSLYDVFRGGPHTAIDAKWIFESRIHQLLARRQEIWLFPICGHRTEVNLVYNDYTASENEDNSITLYLTGSEMHDLAMGDRPQENRYYRLKSNGFLAADSLLLLKHHDQEPILLVFKIACDESDQAIVYDLRKIDDLGLASNVSRCYVVVAPEGIKPTMTVPLEYLKDKGLVNPLAEQGFGVFHRPVSMRTLSED